MTAGDWIRDAAEQLGNQGIESPALEAQLLLAHVIKKDRSWVLAHRDDALELACPSPTAALEELDRLLKRRLHAEPLAYILGWREFYGRLFKVSPEVLIPRQETEELVDVGLALMDHLPMPTLLDVGTGSGCIAVTLKLERPEAHVVALDISKPALDLAKINATALDAKVSFVLSDLFAALTAETFGLIVSNPPYVSQADELPPEIRNHEPHVALFAESGGLAFYDRLAAESMPFLAPDGRVAVEIGKGQEEAVVEIFSAQGWHQTLARKDLAGIARVLAFGRMPRSF